MKTVCAWCPDQPVIHDNGIDDGRVSHGMCRRCQIEQDRQEFIDTFILERYGNPVREMR